MEKHEWKNVLQRTCLVTSVHLVQARMFKICPKKVNKKKYFFCTLNKGNSFYVKKFYILHFL